MSITELQTHNLEIKIKTKTKKKKMANTTVQRTVGMLRPKNRQTQIWAQNDYPTAIR